MVKTKINYQDKSIEVIKTYKGYTFYIHAIKPHNDFFKYSVDIYAYDCNEEYLENIEISLYNTECFQNMKGIIVHYWDEGSDWCIEEYKITNKIIDEVVVQFVKEQETEIC